MPNLVGQRLGPYELIALLGKGGMATVYRARQTLAGRVQREVAVKVIESELALNQEFVARFEREAQTIISLSHAHILKVFDYGQQGEMLYLVMELLGGGSLADRIRAGSLTWEDATRILDQIADAFDYAHSKGIIHRDLKPQNVLLDEAGNAYLSDFGIAKLLDETTGLTQSGTAMGTPAYMAPEQWQGGKVDALSDVYSLGVMLFEMVNGQVPFQGDTPYRVMFQHLYERPPSVRSLRPDLPPGLDPVFERALAKNPSGRFPSAGALAAAFKSTALGMAGATPDATSPLPARGVATPPRTPADTPCRNRLSAKLIIGAIAGVALIALILVVALGGRGDGGAEATGTSAAMITLAATGSATASISVTPSGMPETLVVQVIASATATPTTTPTALPASPTPSATTAPSSTSTTSPSIAPTATQTPSPVPPTATLTATVTASATPTSTLTSTPTASFTTTTTSTFTATPSATSTATPSSTPSPMPTPTLAPGDVRMDAHNVMQVYVPAGCFMMGSLQNDADEVPVHQVCITRPFWLDRYEVYNSTFDDYLSQSGVAFAGTTPAGFDGPSQPRINVSWIEAEAYARWRGCRLPTEAEWEYASRGPDGRTWPWGNTQDSTKANTAESQPAFTAAVDAFADGQSWTRAYNLAGNVWEWTSDWYGSDYYGRSPTNDPLGPDGPGQFRVLRGGSFKQDLLAARGSDRYWAPPDGRADFVGFRVACPAE